MKETTETIQRSEEPEWVAVTDNDPHATPRARRTYRNREWFASQLERGRTMREIAAIAGTSVPTIQSWKIRHNLWASRAPMVLRRPMRTARKAYTDRAWLAAQVRRGFSDLEIARRCRGVSPCVIQYWRRRFGLMRAGGPIGVRARATYANRAWLLAEIESGKTYSEIGVAARVSRETIVNWVNRHGLARGTSVRVPALKTYANRVWLAERVAEGLRDGEIAERAGATMKSVGIWRRRFGIAANRRRTGPRSDVERARRAFGEWLAPRLAKLPLDKRETRVVARMHGICGPVRTLRDIGTEESISGERIRQIHRRALFKIVAAVGAPALKDFPKIAALAPHVG